MMRMCKRYIWLCILSMMLLNGCVATQSTVKQSSYGSTHFAKLANINQFNLKGRIGIQMPGQGYTGSFKWQHLANDTDEIGFFSPVGTQVAKITQTPSKASLVDSKGKTYQAANATALIAEHLGWQIPINNLNDWLLARAKADANTKLTLDSSGRISKLTQNDWSVEYANYRTWDNVDLPSKVSLRKPGFSLKLIIKNWHIKP